ncbi:hypothetical protein EZJ19_04230 [Parasulfuritortus cantonensis]|uniref:Low-complexity protein n=1 Tax=Parasulfuritortus cantonensis TaxID=2528202 RepID=A0A4R1BIL3_9PROT|nr:hypothetical protein [Parasulfuritortus cantonensis]TCJ17165.1 hypothetical protein EZJ19_04230 [Parasulfuritortus cantonensis]
MQRKQKNLSSLAWALAAGVTFALPAAAADNPFATPAGNGAFHQAAADEAKCGKCGAAMGMGDANKAEPGKTSAEKATASKDKAKAAKDKAKSKAKSTEAKAGEAKCGEGKCGAAMGMPEPNKCGAGKKQ